jgi:hypothetical protein
MGLDTGAQTLVTPETSNRFDLVRNPYRKIKAIGTAGSTVVNNRILRNFEFAGKRYGPLNVAVVSLPAPSAIKNLVNPLSGLIGGDILSEYDVDLDLEGKSMTLYKVRGCAKVTPPWTEPYTQVAVRIISKHNILFPIEVEGHRLSALLDTGATNFAITRRGVIHLHGDRRWTRRTVGAVHSSLTAICVPHGFRRFWVLALAFGTQLLGKPAAIGLIRRKGLVPLFAAIGPEPTMSDSVLLSYCRHCK